MGTIVIILIIACVASAKFRAKVFSFILGAAILGLLIYLAIDNFSTLWPIALIGFGIFIFISVIYSLIDDANDKKQIEVWLGQEPPFLSSYDIEKIVAKFITDLKNNDANKKTKYDYNETSIPAGRANCFLSHFDRSIYLEEPMYYSPIRSKDKTELREYGFALTSGGLYIAKQYDEKDNQENYKFKTIELPFAGLFKLKYCSEKELNVKYSDNKTITLKQDQTTVSLPTIKMILESVINSSLPLCIIKNKVNDDDPDTNDYQQKLREADKEFKKNLSANNINDSASFGGVVGAMPNLNQQFEEYGYKFGQRQGHGNIAEYAGNVVDRATGKNVKNVGVTNKKGGADRIVDGVKLQTKYCASATETINAGLEGEYIQNGMVLEVPRDQYNECVKQLANKMNISEEEARRHVKKGFFTYNQALNATKAGSIEGLAIDTLNGIICSTAAGSVTALLSFAVNVWNGVDTKQALKNSLVVAAKVIGRSTMIYVVTMQLSRSTIINPFKKTASGAFASVDNPLYKLGDGLAKKIKDSSIANSSFGKHMELDKMTGQRVVAGGVLIVLMYGPDIVRALRGRISPEQLFKNAAVTTASVIGAKIGSRVIPVPILGSVIGGAVTGFVAKKVLDTFIVDDAIEMYEILREEFIDVVMMSDLTKEEFSSAVGTIFENPKLPKILQDMYAYGNSREYAREFLVNVTIVDILSRRSRITKDMIDIAFSDMTDDIVIDSDVFSNEAPNTTQLSVFCPSCGNMYRKGAKFCNNCGAKRT